LTLVIVDEYTPTANDVNLTTPSLVPSDIEITKFHVPTRFWKILQAKIIRQAFPALFVMVDIRIR